MSPSRKTKHMHAHLLDDVRGPPLLLLPGAHCCCWRWCLLSPDIILVLLEDVVISTVNRRPEPLAAHEQLLSVLAFVSLLLLRRTQSGAHGPDRHATWCGVWTNVRSRSLVLLPLDREVAHERRRRRRCPAVSLLTLVRRMRCHCWMRRLKLKSKARVRLVVPAGRCSGSLVRHPLAAMGSVYAQIFPLVHISLNVYFFILTEEPCWAAMCAAGVQPRHSGFRADPFPPLA